MPDPKQERDGVLLVLVSTLAYATMPILGKAAYAAGVTTLPLLAWRFVLATALLALPTGGPPVPFPPRRKRLVLWALGCLFVGNALAYFKALETEPAAMVALVVFTYPVIVTILSGIAGLDRITTRGLAAAVLAVSGCALTVSGEVGGASIGIVYALLSALIYATYVVLSSRLTAGVPSLVTALHLAQGAGLVCVLLALARGGMGIPTSFAAWGSVLGIALFSTVVALRTFLAGLSRIGPARASVLSSLEVVVTMAFAFLLLGERLRARQWAGAALIIGAVALQNAGELRRLRLPERWRGTRA